MKRAVCLAVAALTLGAATAANAACNHSASAPWKAANKHGLVLNAYTVGEKCGQTAVVLTVADRKGAVLWSTTRLAQHVSVFAGDEVVTGKAVKAALKSWLEIGQDTNYTNTKNLPGWPKGAEGPMREGSPEFGYFAEQDMPREDYLEKRAKNSPLFCFVQGMESETCIIAPDATSIEEFGGMTFPG
jgi:hypothetical protein